MELNDIEILLLRYIVESNDNIKSTKPFADTHGYPLETINDVAQSLKKYYLITIEAEVGHDVATQKPYLSYRLLPTIKANSFLQTINNSTITSNVQHIKVGTENSTQKVIETKEGNNSIRFLLKRLKDYFLKIWKDPVFSKVISVGILGLIAWGTSIFFQNKSFESDDASQQTEKTTNNKHLQKWATQSDTLHFSSYDFEEYKPILDSNIFIGVYYGKLVIGGVNREMISISGRTPEGKPLEITKNIKEKYLQIPRFGDQQIELKYKGFYFLIRKKDNYGYKSDTFGGYGINSSDITLTPINELTMHLIKFEIIPLGPE